MASPVTVGTTPIKLIGVNLKRDTVIFQNNSKEDVYVKKQSLIAPLSVPSPSNYDFILHGAVGEGNDGARIELINSVASFYGVTAKATADVGVSETVKVLL